MGVAECTNGLLARWAARGQVEAASFEGRAVWTAARIWARGRRRAASVEGGRPWDERGRGGEDMGARGWRLRAAPAPAVADGGAACGVPYRLGDGAAW